MRVVLALIVLTACTTTESTTSSEGEVTARKRNQTVTKIRVNGIAADTFLSDPNTGTQGFLNVSHDQINNTSALDFSYATPTIREKFGDAGNFMQMVKTGYTPVYRPQSVAFDKLVDTQYGPDQVLRLIGPDGVAYAAHYLMQKQPDGRWMINGCYLTRLEDQNV